MFLQQLGVSLFTTISENILHNQGLHQCHYWAQQLIDTQPKISPLRFQNIQNTRGNNIYLPPFSAAVFTQTFLCLELGPKGLTTGACPSLAPSLCKILAHSILTSEMSTSTLSIIQPQQHLPGVQVHSHRAGSILTLPPWDRGANSASAWPRAASLTTPSRGRSQQFEARCPQGVSRMRLDAAQTG